MVNKTIIIILAILLLGCSQKGTDINTTMISVSISEHDNLAQCLTEKSVTMYGSEWCSHCQNQKKTFESSFEYINFINCNSNKQECMEADIQGYPTWKINNKNYPGEQSLERLASLSGCSLV